MLNHTANRPLSNARTIAYSLRALCLNHTQEAMSPSKRQRAQAGNNA